MTTVDEIVNDISHISEPVLAGIFLGGGFFICLFGEKFFKQIIFFVGFIGGTIFTYFLFNNISNTTTNNGNDSNNEVISISSTKLQLLISIVVGLFIGFMCVTIYKASVFVTGAIVGIIISQTLWQFTVSNNLYNLHSKINNLTNGHIEIANIVFVLIIAIIFGLIAFKIIKFVLKFVTSFVGAFFTVCGIAYFIDLFWEKESKNVVSMIEFWEQPSSYKNFNSNCSDVCYISVGLWFVLFITGITHQYHLSKKSKNIELRPEYMANSQGSINNNINNSSNRSLHVHYHGMEPQSVQSKYQNNNNKYVQIPNVYEGY